MGVAQFQPEADEPLAQAINVFCLLFKSIKNGKSYVGVTSKDVIKRLSEHNVGSNIWTSTLKYYECFNCKKDAKHRESFYKSGVGRKIKALILEDFSAGSSSVG